MNEHFDKIEEIVERLITEIFALRAALEECQAQCARLKEIEIRSRK